MIFIGFADRDCPTVTKRVERMITQIYSPEDRPPFRAQYDRLRFLWVQVVIQAIYDGHIYDWVKHHEKDFKMVCDFIGADFQLARHGVMERAAIYGTNPEYWMNPYAKLYK